MSTRKISEISSIGTKDSDDNGTNTKIFWSGDTCSTLMLQVQINILQQEDEVYFLL